MSMNRGSIQYGISVESQAAIEKDKDAFDVVVWEGIHDILNEKKQGTEYSMLPFT